MRKYELQIDRYQRIYIEVTNGIDIWLQRRVTTNSNWLNEKHVANISYKNVIWSDSVEEIEE